MIPLDDIRAAQDAIRGKAVRTPLVRLNYPEDDREIYLKLENLQPIASFKIRGAINAFRLAPPDAIAKGVLSASAGNWAQGVAWVARDNGLPCTIVVPEHAPKTKLAAIERLGGRHIGVPYADWWRCLTERQFEGVDGFFLHPVEDDPVMAGNGTIGLEVLEDLPDPDVVLVPWGGGGLASGIASALKKLQPETRVIAVEVETAAPLSASFAAGEMTSVERRATWVDGIGSGGLLPKMWPLAQELLDGAISAPLRDVESALRIIVERNRVIPEGAGACALAVALANLRDARKIVCIVSGGNVDLDILETILRGSDAV